METQLPHSDTADRIERRSSARREGLPARRNVVGRELPCRVTFWNFRLSGSKSNSIRLILVLLIGVALAGFSIWLRQRSESVEPTQVSLPNVSLLEIGDYLVNHVAYLRDTQGNTKLDTVLMPIVPPQVPAESIGDSAGYVGPDVCAECHRDYYDGFVQTTHYKTSSLATLTSVLGSFETGKNKLPSKSERLQFEMLDKAGTLVQKLDYTTEEGDVYSNEFPIDIVTGSGKVGQTYLYWQDENLYQLHASYLSAPDAWINSPGYLDGIADYARPTLPLCLECHSTYFQPVPNTINQYKKDNFVLGVTCEKCHGPGKEHVDFHRENPDSKDGHGILNPNTLNADRALEMCQLCHGGAPTNILREPFSYRPGEPLGEYYQFSESDQLVGVHSNSQLPRLKQSKCFQQSDAMNCTDCHNPHQFERGDMKLFSDRCIECHQPEQCGKFELLGEQTLRQNCIDCHMPSRTMEDIVLMSGDDRHSPPMRDHFIKVWEEESAAFLKKLGK